MDDTDQHKIETVFYGDGSSATGTPGIPRHSPDGSPMSRVEVDGVVTETGVEMETFGDQAASDRFGMDRLAALPARPVPPLVGKDHQPVVEHIEAMWDWFMAHVHAGVLPPQKHPVELVPSQQPTPQSA